MNQAHLPHLIRQLCDLSRHKNQAFLYRTPTGFIYASPNPPLTYQMSDFTTVGYAERGQLKWETASAPRGQKIAARGN